MAKQIAAATAVINVKFDTKEAMAQAKELEKVTDVISKEDNVMKIKVDENGLVTIQNQIDELMAQGIKVQVGVDESYFNTSLEKLGIATKDEMQKIQSFFQALFNTINANGGNFSFDGISKELASQSEKMKTSLSEVNQQIEEQVVAIDNLKSKISELKDNPYNNEVLNETLQWDIIDMADELSDLDEDTKKYKELAQKFQEAIDMFIFNKGRLEEFYDTNVHSELARSLDIDLLDENDDYLSAEESLKKIQEYFDKIRSKYTEEYDKYKELINQYVSNQIEDKAFSKEEIFDVSDTNSSISKLETNITEAIAKLDALKAKKEELEASIKNIADLNTNVKSGGSQSISANTLGIQNVDITLSTNIDEVKKQIEELRNETIELTAKVTEESKKEIQNAFKEFDAIPIEAYIPPGEINDMFEELKKKLQTLTPTIEPVLPSNYKLNIPNAVVQSLELPKNVLSLVGNKLGLNALDSRQINLLQAYNGAKESVKGQSLSYIKEFAKNLLNPANGFNEYNIARYRGLRDYVAQSSDYRTSTGKPVQLRETRTDVLEKNGWSAEEAIKINQAYKDLGGTLRDINNTVSATTRQTADSVKSAEQQLAIEKQLAEAKRLAEQQRAKEIYEQAKKQAQESIQKKEQNTTKASTKKTDATTTPEAGNLGLTLNAENIQELKSSIESTINPINVILEADEGSIASIKNLLQGTDTNVDVNSEEVKNKLNVLDAKTLSLDIIGDFTTINQELEAFVSLVKSTPIPLDLQFGENATQLIDKLKDKLTTVDDNVDVTEKVESLEPLVQNIITEVGKLGDAYSQSGSEISSIVEQQQQKFETLLNTIRQLSAELKNIGIEKLDNSVVSKIQSKAKSGISAEERREISRQIDSLSEATEGFELSSKNVSTNGWITIKGIISESGQEAQEATVKIRNLNDVVSDGKFDLTAYKELANSFKEVKNSAGEISESYLNNINNALESINRSNIITGDIDNVKNQLDKYEEEIIQFRKKVSASKEDKSIIISDEDIANTENALRRISELTSNAQYNAYNNTGTYKGNFLADYVGTVKDNLDKNQPELEAAFKDSVTKAYKNAYKDTKIKVDWAGKGNNQKLVAQITGTGEDGVKKVRTVTGALSEYTDQMGRTSTQIRTLISAETNYVSFGEKWKTNLRSRLNTLSQYITGMEILQRALAQLKKGFSDVRDINSSLTTINQTMSVTQAELQNLGSQSIAFGKELGANAQSVLDAVAIYANANETAESILQKSKPTVMLANASGADTATAADQIQAVVQQFEELQGQEERIVNSYEKISANLAIDFSKGINSMSEAISNSGSVASEAGLSLENYMALVGKIAERTRFEG